MLLSQRLRLDSLCPADLFFPGATKQSFMHLQPGISHPSIYIDTNGQPSSLPDVEGSAVPRLAVQSPDPSVICEYSRGEGQSSSGKGTGCGGDLGGGGMDGDPLGAWQPVKGCGGGLHREPGPGRAGCSPWHGAGGDTAGDTPIRDASLRLPSL